MSGLEDLPADQRAVLELVLARGRDYDEIAQLLRVDRAGVRQRALSAFDALGPETGVPAARRALIADYLLGQLPAQFAQTVRNSLASQPGDRAWARVIASELGSIAAAPLPAIPAAGPDPGHDEQAPVGPVAPTAAVAGPREHPDPAARAASSPGATPPRRSSRVGGAILLGLGALIVIAVIVVVIANSGGSRHNSSRTSNPTAASSTPSSTTGTGTGTSTSPTVLAQTNLTPAISSSKARGEAEVFAQTGKQFLAVVAENLAANSHNYYAVWLTNGGSDSRFLGFAPAVTSNGQLEAATQLASTDTRYKHLLLTLETQAHPKAPGTVILSGPFNLK